ncbi:hypothetical protein RKE25_20070 [Dyella sp. BiH032]|uniref:hypothetical protein n=1 Tax=Dyella sp. BiH032 TaxID=3075430 RepID=UPI0028936371|nr:hypothetical protein [Dyella sp. BiH032]WNL45681.1 hypothetical protein RKE25_20070 [Dyella sp. BiH032]
MNLRVHIDRLVVDEALLGHMRPAALRTAVEDALRRELARSGTPERLAKLGHLDAVAPAKLTPARHPGEGLATRLAATVGASLGIGTSAANTARHQKGALPS